MHNSPQHGGSMAKVHIQLEFDSVEEMIEQLGGNIARGVGLGGASAEDGKARFIKAVYDTPVGGGGYTSEDETTVTTPPGTDPWGEPDSGEAPEEVPEGHTRKRRAFLRKPNGDVIETLDQRVVDDWVAAGAEHITRAEYDRAELPVQQAQAEPAAAPEVDEVEEEVLFEKVRHAVRQVNSAKGLPVLLDLLAEFKAERVSDLQEADYPKFLVRAGAVING